MTPSSLTGNHESAVQRRAHPSVGLTKSQGCIASGGPWAVLDAQGRALAATAEGRQWLAEAGATDALADALNRLSAGLPSELISTANGPPLRCDRLDGAAGMLAVLWIIPQPESDPDLARDVLTLLPDRRALVDWVATWQRRSAPHAFRWAALFLDLDNFKQVNDRHGHAVGDVALRTLAQRWQTCVRDDDLIVRYGGDEFVVLLRGAVDAADVEPVMVRLHAATAEPVVVDGVSLSLAATVGWAAAAAGESCIEDVIAAADRDMYSRKQRVLR